MTYVTKFGLYSPLIQKLAEMLIILSYIQWAPGPNDQFHILL